MRSIVASYWQAGLPVLNFGEALVPRILEFLGYRCLPDTPDHAYLKAPRLMSISSELHQGHIRQLRRNGKRVVVWGSSHGHGRIPPKDWLDVRSVRGHLTRDALGLGDEFPVGDPGFLVSEMYPRESDQTDAAIWVPHFHNRGKTAPSEWNAVEVDVIIHPNCLEDFVTRLNHARFIYTSSLHVTVAAIAFQVPFALCLGKRECIDKPRKWDDMWSTLRRADGSPAEGSPYWCHSPEEAERWYTDIGQYLRPPDLADMLRAFPHDLGVEIE